MALQILEKNGTFYLDGHLNTSTLKSFTSYFDYNLSQSNKVIINIDSIIEIDKSGLEAMRKFTQVAVLKQKIFSIVGYGCKEIYDDFNQVDIA
jgi:ABC-type transporter Mla MlaB component